MAKAEGGGGVKIGGVRVGCGWFVLLIAGGVFALWRWQPGLVRAAAGAVVRAVPAAAGLVKRAIPKATPAPAPTSVPAPTATPQPLATPTPEAAPTPAPSETDESAATEPSAAPETTDLVVGGGKAAVLGETVVVKIDGAQPVAVMLGSGDAPAGLEKGLLGMRAGGKRRVSVPDSARRASFPPGGEPPVGSGGESAREVEMVEVW